MSNMIHSYKRKLMLSNPKIKHTTRAERKRAAQARLSVFDLLVRFWGIINQICFVDEVDGVKAKNANECKTTYTSTCSPA